MAMNLLQAGYDILVTLSICDGDFDEGEGAVILEFLEDNHDVGQFDPGAENKMLMALDNQAVMARFREVAQFFKDNSTVGDREALLEFGIDLIMRDGTLSEEENALVRELADSWEVPLQPLVARAMNIT